MGISCNSSSSTGECNKHQNGAEITNHEYKLERNNTNGSCDVKSYNTMEIDVKMNSFTHIESIFLADINLRTRNIIYTNELRDVLGRDARYGLGADDRAEPGAVRQADGEAEAAAGAEDLHQHHRQGNIVYHSN